MAMMKAGSKSTAAKEESTGRLVERAATAKKTSVASAPGKRRVAKGPANVQSADELLRKAWAKTYANRAKRLD